MEDRRTGEDRKIWTALIVIILLFTAVIFVARNANLTRERQAESPAVARYTNYAYGVKLQYPPEWVPLRGYDHDRYGSGEGFFGILSGGDDESLDEMVESELRRDRESYGASPEIQALSVDGQPARLILGEQAALIAEYPDSIEVEGDPDKFFILVADRKNIHYIVSTLTFIRDESAE